MCEPGSFSGIIGGPPCQPYSIANQSESIHKDGVGLFWEIVKSLRPDFAVMEEVDADDLRAHPGIPKDVQAILLRDWDCGGLTNRTRGIWYRGFQMDPPGRRDGEPAWSVLARSWDTVVSSGEKPRTGMHNRLSAVEACRLQGYPEFMAGIAGERRVVGEKLIVHMMGNGVPRAMGEWIVRAVMGKQQPIMAGQQMSLVAA